MAIIYPESLPRGLRASKAFSLVSPLMRSQLDSGRARQRRKFTSVPEMVEVSWIFNDQQALVFEAWWRDMLVDGSQWFECPLDHPLGYQLYTARFAEVYAGPNWIGNRLWSYSASLELFERIAAPLGYGDFPEYILDAGILDIAMNELWPLNEWQSYAGVTDNAINKDWPKP